MEQAPLINCHTHVFTVKDVPPMLARTILPWPLYLLVRTGWIAGLFGWWIRLRQRIIRQFWYKKMIRRLYLFRMALKRYFILRFLKIAGGLYFLAAVFYDQYLSLLKPLLQKQGIQIPFLDRVHAWLGNTGFILVAQSLVMKIFLLLMFLLLFPSGRNLVLFILRQVNRFFRMLPGKQTTELLKRYLNIVRYANYKEQFKVFSRLKLQYPPGSKMVVLPMDMAFMGAGKPARPFAEQMEMLAAIKANHPATFFPFLFIDPRRMTEEGPSFFDYKIVNHQVQLEPCFIKTYMEDKQFSGFKIYPALGYYPFDERLLALWKYAADNGIPIMTHCIRGVVYYRGSKESSWDFHPVFESFLGSDQDPASGEYAPMLLPQMKPVDVQEIFTHPMNYVCLYKKELLARLIAQAKDTRLQELFGYRDGQLERGLGHLKICFGHFGGEDEWLKFFEQDRSNFGHQLIQAPTTGIEFLSTNGQLKKDKPAQLWQTADWYSIICSLMLQHPHVYADISYILHGDQEILPLLRHTLQDPKLRERVLYGSDFYVVRNHKSDKNMLADIKGGLPEKEFDQIARVNPVAYLQQGTISENQPS